MTLILHLHSVCYPEGSQSILQTLINCTVQVSLCLPLNCSSSGCETQPQFSGTQHWETTRKWRTLHPAETAGWKIKLIIFTFAMQRTATPSETQANTLTATNCTGGSSTVTGGRELGFTAHLEGKTSRSTASQPSANSIASRRRVPFYSINSCNVHPINHLAEDHGAYEFQQNHNLSWCGHIIFMTLVQLLYG